MKRYLTQEWEIEKLKKMSESALQIEFDYLEDQIYLRIKQILQLKIEKNPYDKKLGLFTSDLIQLQEQLQRLHSEIIRRAIP